MAHNYNIITDLIKKVNWEILYMYKVTISPPFSTYDAGWSLMWKLALLFASQWLLSTQVGFCLLLPPQPCSHFLFPQGPQLLQLSSASSAYLTPGYRQHQVGSVGMWNCGLRGKVETAEGGGGPLYHVSHWTRSPWVISIYDHTPVRDAQPYGLRPSPGWQAAKLPKECRGVLLRDKWHPEKRCLPLPSSVSFSDPLLCPISSVNTPG